MRSSKFLPLALALLIALTSAVFSRVAVVALLGDIDLNNLVNQADLNAIAQSLGLRNTDANYQIPRDLNLDNKIDVFDLAIAGRSYGSPRLFHYTRQISNCDKCAYEQDSCLDGLGRINILWSDSDAIYFSRIDRFGNTLVDDTRLSTLSSTASLGIACGRDGTAHLFWQKGNYLYQARFDRWGYAVIPSQKVYNETIGDSYTLGASLDDQGNAYAFFRRYVRNTPTLLRVSPQLELMQSRVGLVDGTTNTTSLYHRLEVDSANNLHLMWYELEGTDRIYYARYASDASPSLEARAIGYTAYDGAVNGARQPELEVDTQGNAYILWHQHNTPNLFLEKIKPDGTTPLDDYVLFSQWGSGGYTPPSDLALDAQGNLHLLTITTWGKTAGASRSAYGSYNPDGTPLKPPRWILYPTPMDKPRVMIDSSQDIHITFSSNESSGYPSCKDDSLCYLGSAFDPAAYDLSRSDLGIDAAHLAYDPLIARWGGTLAITTTVFSEGWEDAAASKLWIGLESESGEVVGDPIEVVIDPLARHNQQTFQNLHLTLPGTPPVGMEEMEYLRLHFKVDPQNTLAETSEENNELLVPILVQKLPTKTGLFLIVEDETNTARGGESERVHLGMASIQGGSYSQSNIPVTDDLTVLARDIPVSDSLINYTIGWQWDGYAVPTPVVIGVQRNSSNPYLIDYTPSNTAVLKTNRWGSLSGTITAAGTPLAGATVRLVGQGLNIETTTDANGSFSPGTQPKLAQLIPGEYQIRVSKAGYARLSEPISINPLAAATFNRTMTSTSDAYLHGNVINTYGTPIGGASVNACGATTQTDSQGIFDLMNVSAGCTSLSITRSGYAVLNQTLSLTAGLESLLDDLQMTFDPPLSGPSADGRVASRVIDQSSGGLLPDPPEDANWVEEKIFDKFKDKFWPEFRMYIVYGAYAYRGAVSYSGPSDDRRLQFLQAVFEPQTFEVHALLASVTFNGAPLTIPIVSDSGIRSAIQVLEARLVNVKTGQVLKTVTTPLEGAISEQVLDQAVLTYDFGGAAISDWENTEVWLYYKVGRNESNQFLSSPLLYQHDRQIMKFDLSSGEVRLEYGLGEFPLP